jgi:ankyrin repeat protein
MKTNLKNKAFAFALLFALGIVAQPLLGMNTNQTDLNEKLIEASKNYNIQEVRRLIKDGADVNARNKYDNTPLIWATHNSKLEAIKLLIQNGANVNTQNRDGDTPLLWAACNNNLDTIKLLVQNGANVNTQNRDGDTPLLWAAFNNNLDTVKFLVQNGANVNTQNRDGETAYDIASRKGCVNICNYLTNIELYNTSGTIVTTNQQNQLVVPNYFSLAVIKEELEDIKSISKHAKSTCEKGFTVDYVQDHFNTAQRLKKNKSQYELAWIGIQLGMKPTTEDCFKISTQHNAFIKINNGTFTDVLLLCDQDIKNETCNLNK